MSLIFGCPYFFAELQTLETRHQQQLDREFEGLIAASAKKEHKLREVRRAFEDYRAWIKSTLQIEEHSHRTVAMVFAAEEGKTECLEFNL
jgi:hypothetical protein